MWCARSLTSLPSTHRGEETVPKIVFAVDIGLDIIPLELVLPTSRSAHSVALVSHTDSRTLDFKVYLTAAVPS